MKLKLLPLFFSILSLGLFAQNVGIGTPTPHASAKLEINANNSGLLIPRVALVAVNNATAPVNAPATGLLVYNTNAVVTGGNGTGFYYWDGTIWRRLQDAQGDAWQLLGNAGTNPNNNFVGTTDVQPLVFRTNNVENMRINTNGNIGVGTTLNTARMYLNIAPTDNTQYGAYIQQGGTAGVKYGIYNNMQTTSTTNKYGMYNNFANVDGSKWGYYNFIGGANTGILYGFYNQFTNSSNSARYGLFNTITNASGNIYGAYTYINPNTANNSNNIFGYWTQILNNGTGNRYGVFVDVPGGANAFALRAQSGNTVFNDVAGNYYFRVKGAGQANLFYIDAATNNIGIMQGTPVERLHVNANRVLVENGSDAMYCSYNTASGFRFELIGSYPGWDTRAIYLGGYNVNNVGGGAYSAANKVYCGGAFGSIPIYATGFINVSTKTLKQNISASIYGLNEVLKINPVRYQYNFDPSGVYQLGFIAEELAQIVPEIVAFHDEENNPASQGKAMGIDYSKMTAVLVKAIQEQQEQIEQIKAENKAIKQELERLKNN